MKDIQHLETGVGVNVNIFYLSMIMGVGGIIFKSVLEWNDISTVLFVFSVLLMIWCDTHFDSESALSSTMHVRVAAG